MERLLSTFDFRVPRAKRKLAREFQRPEALASPSGFASGTQIPFHFLNEAQ